jgi:hypothetical protein
MITTQHTHTPERVAQPTNTMTPKSKDRTKTKAKINNKHYDCCEVVLTSVTEQWTSLSITFVA